MTSEHCPAWWICSETGVEEALPQNSSLRKPSLFSLAFFARWSKMSLSLIRARSVYHLPSWVVSGGSWARVEVWAIDSDLVSPGAVHTVPIVDSSSGLESWVSSLGLPLLIVTIASLSFAGISYWRMKQAEIAKDMQVIESWSSFDPRELDDEFDSEV